MNAALSVGSPHLRPPDSHPHLSDPKPDAGSGAADPSFGGSSLAKLDQVDLARSASQDGGAYIIYAAPIYGADEGEMGDRPSRLLASRCYAASRGAMVQATGVG